MPKENHKVTIEFPATGQKVETTTADIEKAAKRIDRGGDPGPGHNAAGGVAADRLRSFVERIERLEEEKAAVAADVREFYAEAKAAGYDTKVLRQTICLRKMDPHDRATQWAELETYCRALDVQLSFDLGDGDAKADGEA